jgi:hypothetical protein
MMNNHFISSVNRGMHHRQEVKPKSPINVVLVDICRHSLNNP